MQNTPFQRYADPPELSPVERIDRLLASVPPGHPLRRELTDLRAALSQTEGTMEEARAAIEKLEQIVQKLSAPANRIGTFLCAPNAETAQIVVGGADYYCNADPRLSLASLKKGTRVLVNEAFAIVGDLGYDGCGPVAKVTEVLGGERLRVGTEHGIQSVVLQRGADLMEATVKAGDEVRVDANFRVAVEVLSRSKADDYYLDAVPELPWEKVTSATDSSV